MTLPQAIDLIADIVFVCAVAGVSLYMAHRKFGGDLWYWVGGSILAILAGYINVYYIWG